MKSKLNLAVAVVLAAGGMASAQSLVTLPPNNGSGGVFMDLTPISGPLEVTSFETPVSGSVGLQVSVEVWVRPGSYVGFDGSNVGWMLHETVVTTAQGTTVNAPLNLSLPISLPDGVPTGVYLHAITTGGGIRYQGTGSTATTNFSNADLQLFSDVARTGVVPFAGTRNSPRVFAGVVNYQPGGPPVPGACCFNDGTCQILLGLDCFNAGGTFRGGGSDCATANCPQPGACCLEEGTCIMTVETACTQQGGTFHGVGTDCATIPACPRSITTSFAGTSSTTGAGAGAYFLVTPLDPQGITIESFDINSAAAAGTAITAHVYAKPGHFEGFETDASAWLFLGEVATTAAGVGSPTPVPIGGFAIPQGETWSLRVGAANGGIRYTGSTTPPSYENSHVRLDMGKVQTALFSGSLFGTSTSLRGWDGRIHYELGAVITTGACCLPDGTCDELREVVCTGQGGTYHGDNTTCAGVPPCPKGACCLIDGSCVEVAEAGCVSLNGVYSGDGSDCATANCPQPGACCLADQLCIVVMEGVCNAAGGTYSGDGTSCIGPACGELYMNGSMFTEIGAGFSGHHLSRASTNVTSAGSTVTLDLSGPQFRLADDFTLDAAADIESITVFAYITGTGANAYGYPPVSPWTGVDMKIWDGVPDAPGSTVVATSTTMASTGFSGVYRLFNTGVSTNTDRPVMGVEADFAGLHLPAGTYWIDYQLTGLQGTNATGFVPYIMELDVSGLPNTPAGNARQLTSTGWVETAVEPSLQAVDFPFIVTASSGPACYANCDGSTVEPILNVDDFTCFINAFAQAQGLPHEQQVTSQANCDGSTIAPVLNVDDFTCFINEFALGCN